MPPPPCLSGVLPEQRPQPRTAGPGTRGWADVPCPVRSPAEPPLPRIWARSERRGRADAASHPIRVNGARCRSRTGLRRQTRSRSSSSNGRDVGAVELEQLFREKPLLFVVNVL